MKDFIILIPVIAILMIILIIILAPDKDYNDWNNDKNK